MLDLIQDDADERSASADPRTEAASADPRTEAASADPRAEAPERLPVRDWSNVVFSMAFCEEARRAYEKRADSPRQRR